MKEMRRILLKLQKRAKGDPVKKKKKSGKKCRRWKDYLVPSAALRSNLGNRRSPVLNTNQLPSQPIIHCDYRWTKNLL